MIQIHITRFHDLSFEENVRKTVMVVVFFAPDSLIVAESIVCLEMSQLFESKVLYFVFDVS